DSPAASRGSPRTPAESPERPTEDRTRGAARSARRSSLPAAELVQYADIDGVETLADAEQENADDDESDQNRECHTDLHHQRHSLGSRRGEVDAVLQGHEADNLAHGIAPRHHHQQSD